MTLQDEIESKKNSNLDGSGHSLKSKGSSHHKKGIATIQNATHKVFHKLEGGMNKLGLGIEKAARTVSKTTTAAVLPRNEDPRNEGLVKTKSQGSKRIGLYSTQRTSNHPDDDDSDSLALDSYDSNVNNIKFQAHDFHTRGDDASNNNFYKFYHLGRLLYKTEWCRIHVCRSYMTKRERVVKIVRETCGLCHEFDILKNTDHPNLPIMYELFQGKGFEFFIVMTYAEGGTLLNYLEAKRSVFPRLGGIQAGATGMVKGRVGKADKDLQHESATVALKGYGERRDNQWDLELGKRGVASQSPMGRAQNPAGREECRRPNSRSPQRRDRRRSPNPRTKNSPERDNMGGNIDHESPHRRDRRRTKYSPERDVMGGNNDHGNEKEPSFRHRNKKVNKKSPLSEEDAKLIMLQLLSCLRYCHDHKIVHCDIKAGNIMFNYPKDFTSITLIDFDTSFLQDYPDEKITYQRAPGTGKDAAYLAPEVIQTEPCYDQKSDIWSCGVTLYKIMSNTLPFVESESDTEDTIRKRIAESPRVIFPESEWSGISDDAKDFIKFLLHPRPFERPNARQAVNHQWLASARDRMVEVLEEEGSGAKVILQNLRRFDTADTKMKEAVCAFIASHLLTKEEVQPIERVFKALDTQHDGRIRRYELKQAYYRVFNKLITEKELDKIMKRIDNDGNGDISYGEFSMAAVNKNDLLSHSRLKTAFDLFDKQNKGYVTHDELREAFHFVEMDINYLNKIIKHVDKDGDGKITFAEFEVMMTHG